MAWKRWWGNSKAAQNRYTVYAIVRKEDRKTYVGLTRRALSVRVRAHAIDAMRRRTSLGSLGSAIRQVILSGHDFASAFDVECLAEGLSVDEAREAEILWIERLNTAAPRGYNLMPGGASVGGPANSRPVELEHPVHGRQQYPSLYAAIDRRNAELATAKLPQLQFGTVYARLMIGWPVEEALGYAPHEDRRTLRRPFVCEGAVLRRLREVSEATGLSVDTLRSRLHRAAAAGVVSDIREDRRRRPTGRILARLPHPVIAGDRTLTMKAFAFAAELPPSTVAHRYHQLLRRGEDPSAMTDGELIHHLTSAQDRRRMIRLELPSGAVLTGGEREVIRQVLSNPALSAVRPEQLGLSAIRRRLRLKGRRDAQSARWAFGFAPEHHPQNERTQP